MFLGLPDPDSLVRDSVPDPHVFGPPGSGDPLVRDNVPNPDPPDPPVFGPPGSGSIRQARYGSGSGSFYLQAKIVRNTLTSSVFWLLLEFLSLKNDVNVRVPSKSNKQKNFFLN
jgi:hypothetical protein